jgi:cytochrome b pre-mRNA-processing protein 3
VSFLTRIFGGRRERESYRPLYDSVVNAGREPLWYVEGQVPDTLDGRFDVISALLALVLLRLERDEAQTRTASVLLTELFIDDMEGTVRQIGIGDLMVGKHVGKMMGALGGRLGAFRAAIAERAGFRAAVVRNVFHDAPPSDAAVAFVSGRLARFHEALAALPVGAVLEGKLPRP